MMASIRIAAARPTPNYLKIIACRAAKIGKTPTITIAALVTTPAVVLIPWATACCRAEEGRCLSDDLPGAAPSIAADRVGAKAGMVSMNRR